MPVQHPRRHFRPLFGRRSTSAPQDLSAPAPDRTAPVRRSAPSHPSLMRLAASLVELCEAGQPADEVLREGLRKQPGVTRADARIVSHAVFACFRWHGWVQEEASVEVRLERALEFAATFAAQSAAISDTELAEFTVPAWVREHARIPLATLRAWQAEPVLWLRARRGQAADLAQKLERAEPGPLPDTVRYAGEADLFRHPLFQAGELQIQDVASQAVGLVCAPRPGHTWWDACAGQGGKLLHLSELMKNQGLIWASDRAEWRLKQLKQRAARAKCFNYRAATWDGGPHLPTRTLFDGVLVDAPCAGLGTWGRNPHARWTVTPADVRELAAVQVKLLTHCAASVKPGGRLIYAVCTLTREETDGVCDAFAAAHPAFVPSAEANPFSPTQAPRPRQLWWPHETGGNGMFVAVWQRTA